MFEKYYRQRYYGSPSVGQIYSHDIPNFRFHKAHYQKIIIHISLHQTMSATSILTAIEIKILHIQMSGTN